MPKRSRRTAWRRWSWRLLGAGLLAWGAAILGGMNPSVPSDAVLNLLPIPAVDLRLAAPAETRALVVVQHGLWRSAWAMWRIERALRAHGYEVLNVSYPSTRATIEDHAAALAGVLHEHLQQTPDPLPAVYFVGHSLGGLVIRSYLSRKDAVPAAGCVFIATPHRGAGLVSRWRGAFLFRCLMGDKAALQLTPGDPCYATLRPLGGVPVGTIIGGKGDGKGYSRNLPGDDDGTVAVAEAHLE